MSSDIDLEDQAPGEEDAMLEEGFGTDDDIPPQAFYLALKKALIQLANQPTSYP